MTATGVIRPKRCHLMPGTITDVRETQESPGTGPIIFPAYSSQSAHSAESTNIMNFISGDRKCFRQHMGKKADCILKDIRYDHDCADGGETNGVPNSSGISTIEATKLEPLQTEGNTRDNTKDQEAPHGDTKPPLRLELPKTRTTIVPSV